MQENLGRIVKSVFDIDWILLLSALPLVFAGLATMNSFVGQNYFFDNQLIWLAASIVVFFGVSLLDLRFLRRTGVITGIFLFSVLLLLSLFILGRTFKGARSWFDFGIFAFQPSDPIKLAVILVLAKYFSRRHIEIANFRHILVSGLYAFTLFLLIFLQPDFGSAVIVALIWLGMVLVSGISKKHLLLLFFLAVAAFSSLWFFVFQDYQKERITTFLYPYADISGAGYSAYQSVVAIGSGELLGKGVGYGTQSRLEFLPEYETDFIFAAFAEEWGFLGVVVLFTLFSAVIWRIVKNAMRGATNFEVFFGFGLAALFISHFLVHVGMNLGLLPITGTTMPFLSYGGSHLLTEFLGLGMLMAMRRYAEPVEKSAYQNELVGV